VQDEPEDLAQRLEGVPSASSPVKEWVVQTLVGEAMLMLQPVKRLVRPLGVRGSGQWVLVLDLQPARPLQLQHPQEVGSKLRKEGQRMYPS
jgi:hypothetical protein